MYNNSINTHQMKSHPLGIDNPYLIRGEIGSTRWGLYLKNPFQKIASFRTQFDAYDARREILKFEGYDA